MPSGIYADLIWMIRALLILAYRVAGLMTLDYWMLLLLILVITTGLVVRVKRYLEEGQKSGDEGPILSRVGGVDLPAAGGGPTAFNLAKNRQWEKCRSGSTTSAVQQGSVPRKPLFELQRIAIT